MSVDLVCHKEPQEQVTSGNRYPACSLSKFAFLLTPVQAAMDRMFT